MPDHPKIRTSFTPAQRWKIAFDVLLRTALVVAVVAMLNYIGAEFFHRFYLSSQTRIQLASRTVNLLHSITNHVEVTLYYDRNDEFYPSIVALLNEYRSVNPKISVQTVDYLNDPGGAQKIKDKFGLASTADKDLVIFSLDDGRFKIAPGDTLSQYKLESVAPDDPKQKELEFRRKPVQFNGEMMFTAILQALENPQPLKAYFLQGHGEPSLTDSGNVGYLKFKSLLNQNYISVTNLAWLGEAGVPADCNLLIIAGPTKSLNEVEAQKVAQYLHEGGRLLVLFNFASAQISTGLEPILQTWGVNVLDDIVQDPEHTYSTRDIIVDQFENHPVVNSLAQVRLQLYWPRPVEKIVRANPPANAPQVDELFTTSTAGKLLEHREEPPRAYPLACAVEQKPVPGVSTPRGNTRIIVLGDSVFLGNYYIEADGNRDFINSALNWLMDRPQLLEGLNPRPVTEFRLLMSRQQLTQIRWLLLGALPGGVLLLGGLVWLVRRN